MFLGGAAVGKTSLMRGLMNQPLPDKAIPFMLAETHSVKCSSTAGDHHWAEVTEDDEITEEVQAVLNSIMTHSFTKPRYPIKKVSSSHPEVDQHKKNVMLQGSKQQSLSTADQQVFLHLWDCGGHPVFLDVLPAFMSSQTIFLFVFNASKSIDIDWQWLPSKFTTVTTLSLLHKWMAIIHTRFGGAQHGILPADYPRVVLVGTHADQIAPGKPLEEQKRIASEVLDELFASIKGKEYADMVLGSVVVDNTTAGMGPQADSGFTKLQEIIYSFVHDKLTVETPVSWIHFHNVLQLYTKNKKPVIQLDEVYIIAAECYVPRDEVHTALQFYHKCGVFLYYPDIEGLGSVMFLEPQLLVDQLGKLFASCKRQDKDLWDTLTRHGILVEPLYKAMLGNVRKHNLTPAALIGVLEHFLLAAPIGNTGLYTRSGKVKEYFAPHMLQRHRNKRRTFLSSSAYAELQSSSLKKAAPIHLIFSSGYVPPGYYVRLATSLSSKQGVMVLFHPIYRDQISMDIGVDRLTITEHIDTVELQYSRQAAVIEPFRESCRRLLLLLNECFSEVHQWLPGATPQLAFPCLECSEVQPSRAMFCPFTLELSISQQLHCCQMGHKSLPTNGQQYWLLYEMNAIERDQAQFEVHILYILIMHSTYYYHFLGEHRSQYINSA